MLEIAALIWLFLKLKGMLELKGRGKGLAFLGPLFWLLGEFLGAFAGAVILAMVEIDNVILVYLFALLGAAIGGYLAYLIVKTAEASALHCPACKVVLPGDLNRNYSKLDCRACGTALSVWESKVTVQPAEAKA